MQVHHPEKHGCDGLTLPRLHLVEQLLIIEGGVLRRLPTTCAADNLMKSHTLKQKGCG